MHISLHDSWRRPALAALLAAGAIVASLAAAQADARPATKSERSAMIAAFYTAQGNFAPPRCWRTLVASRRPRTGIVAINYEATGCNVGDGYVIMRRPSRTSARWKVVWQGSDLPPCRLITAKMAEEFWGRGATCTK